jgi:hypothetical protein
MSQIGHFGLVLFKLPAMQTLTILSTRSASLASAKQIVFTTALLAASLAVAQADVITAWTFENNALAINNSPAPSTGSGTATSIGMATFPTPNIGVTTDDVGPTRLASQI